MKKWPALALVGGLALSGAVTTNASAAAAPTNVQIRWADSSHQAIRLTWDETSAQPNRILLQAKEGDTPIREAWTAADAPNQMDIPASWSPSEYPRLWFSVAFGSQGDPETGPLTSSPQFDAQRPSPPQLVSAVPSGSSGLAVEWKAGPVTEDLTPNDPLDLALPPNYSSFYQVGAEPPVSVGPIELSGTRANFTTGNPAFTFSVASRNEWGTTTAKLVDAAASAPTLNVPAWVVYDNLLDLTGKLAGTDPRTVILQARNSPTSAWYTVTSRLNTTGSYMYTFQFTPSRQYRVQVPNAVAGNKVWYGGYSAVGTNNVQHKVNASFPTSTVKRGETARATLGVLPGHNGTATLQRYVGSAWTTVGPVQFTNGLGDGYVRSTTPGSVSYRYYVPTATISGGTYHAAYSPNFVLTTT
ncbi:hypothetical protein [Kribbella lupini]|uniref:Uncharacterized protein n=1 Tax=Kribbella lupini TaxID=291602 RepID=A0ABN2CED6_9ACTN